MSSSVRAVGLAVAAVLFALPSACLAGSIFIDASHWGTVDSTGATTADAGYQVGVDGYVATRAYLDFDIPVLAGTITYSGIWMYLGNVEGSLGLGFQKAAGTLFSELGGGPYYWGTPPLYPWVVVNSGLSGCCNVAVSFDTADVTAAEGGLFRVGISTSNDTSAMTYGDSHYSAFGGNDASSPKRLYIEFADAPTSAPEPAGPPLIVTGLGSLAILFKRSRKPA